MKKKKQNKTKQNNNIMLPGVVMALRYGRLSRVG